MSKVILLIHGRSNKPQVSTLTRWWLNSINDGQEFIDRPLVNEAITPVEMAYYADVYYPAPEIAAEIDQPYREPRDGAIKVYNDSLFDFLRDIGGEVVGAGIDAFESLTGVLGTLAEQVVKGLLADLHSYYNDQASRDAIQQRLIDKIVQYQQHEIILVSHSMGTIVAYDVLRRMGKDLQYNGMFVEHFVTLGSPLGFAPVKSKIFDQHNGQLRTPSIVRGSWNNFADGRDIVTLDTRLSDDFASNSHGIKVVDDRVACDYPDNPHKSYGYLRTPEFSSLLSGLL